MCVHRAAHIAEPPPAAPPPMSEPAGAAEPPDMSEPIAKPAAVVVVVVVVSAFLWRQPASAAETKIATTIDIFFIFSSPLSGFVLAAGACQAAKEKRLLPHRAGVGAAARGRRAAGRRHRAAVGRAAH